MAVKHRFRIFNGAEIFLLAPPSSGAFGPYSSLGYQPLAHYAGTIAATGFNAAQDEGCALLSVAPSAPSGVMKTAEALIAAG